MPLERWLEFQGTKVLAVHGNPDRVCVDLEASVQPSEGAEASPDATSWLQQVRIEIDFPDVNHGIARLPAELARGRLVCDRAGTDRQDGLSVPCALQAMIVVELVTTSGEKLQISGEGLRAIALGEPPPMQPM